MGDVPVGLCGCGCGRETNVATRNHIKSGYTIGERLRYIHGHHARGKTYPARQFIDPVVAPRLCACGCGGYTRPASQNNAKYGYVRGYPVPFIKGHDKRKTPHEYVEEDRGYSTPCWIWTRGKTGSGYGAATWVGQRGKGAHIVYFERVNGPVPAGMFVCHHCDKPACVRPDHLFLGTPLDNMQDKIRKGRANYSPSHER